MGWPTQRLDGIRHGGPAAPPAPAGHVRAAAPSGRNPDLAPEYEQRAEQLNKPSTPTPWMSRVTSWFSLDPAVDVLAPAPLSLGRSSSNRRSLPSWAVWPIRPGRKRSCKRWSETWIPNSAPCCVPRPSPTWPNATGCPSVPGASRKNPGSQGEWLDLHAPERLAGPGLCPVGAWFQGCCALPEVPARPLDQARYRAEPYVYPEFVHGKRRGGVRTAAATPG